MSESRHVGAALRDGTVVIRRPRERLVGLVLATLVAGASFQIVGSQH